MNFWARIAVAILQAYWQKSRDDKARQRVLDEASHAIEDFRQRLRVRTAEQSGVVEQFRSLADAGRPPGFLANLFGRRRGDVPSRAGIAALNQVIGILWRQRRFGEAAQVALHA